MLAPIDPQALTEAVAENVQRALQEDLGGTAGNDVSAALIGDDVPARATVITRSPGVFCGAPWVQQTASQVDTRIEVAFAVSDGAQVSGGQTLFTLQGPAPSLLTAERTMLNFVQLLSATATRTAHYVRLLEGTGCTLLDTRKTIPGLRLAQKYAVSCGGGANHRIGLFDAYLLKENHIAAAGSIGQAVSRARAAHHNMPIEVEVENMQELAEALAAGADIAMLDNFSLSDTRSAVAMAQSKIKLEASGGIDEASITEIARTGVDYISVGELTKKIDPMDLSMRFDS